MSYESAADDGPVEQQLAYARDLRRIYLLEREKRRVTLDAVGSSDITTAAGMVLASR